MTTIALGIPYTPWQPEREANMVKLRQLLDTEGKADFYREFTERAANSVWSEQLWTWQRETGADWGVEIQDDVKSLSSSGLRFVRCCQRSLLTLKSLASLLYTLWVEKSQEEVTVGIEPLATSWDGPGPLDEKPSEISSS